MTEAEKQQLVSQFNQASQIAQQLQCPMAQGYMLGDALKQLGQSINAISVTKEPDASH
jgi:cytochrome c-type biogenesis protein CcmH/NrfF